MKELESMLKIVSDGLKTLAKGVEAIAEKVDEAAKSQNSMKSTPKKTSKPAKKAKAAEKTIRKAANKKEVKSATASDNVLEIIVRSKKGVAMAKIMDKTGYNQKKVANIIYRLKKQRKIKSIVKGVYAKV